MPSWIKTGRFEFTSATDLRKNSIEPVHSFVAFRLIIRINLNSAPKLFLITFVQWPFSRSSCCSDVHTAKNSLTTATIVPVKVKRKIYALACLLIRSPTLFSRRYTSREHINYILESTRSKWTYLIMRYLITLVNVFMVACRQFRIKTVLSPY